MQQKITSNRNKIIENLTCLVNKYANGKHTIFAKQADIPPSTFQGYLNGRPPHFDHLLRIRETYGINIDWLMTGEGDELLRKNNEGNTDTFNSSAPINERRIVSYGRRKTDLPMSKQCRRAVEGLLYLEEVDQDGFTLICGKIIEREEKTKEMDEVKKIGNIDA